MIRYRGRDFHVRDGETVLDCLERSGEKIPSSCRSGVCQSCLLQARSGDVPPESQKGVKPALRKRGFFLACACRPHADLELANEQSEAFDSEVIESRELAPGVFRVLLHKPQGFEFEAGQFVQLVRPHDALTRPYSIASLPGEELLELHVAVHAKGRMSTWLCEAVGHSVRLRGPLGECCYQSEDPDRPILLIGTGTGLAPLLGVLRRALGSGHRGPIALVHGARDQRGLYSWNALLELAEGVPNLRVQGHVLEPPASGPHVQVGPIGPAILRSIPNLTASEIYLCGSPDVVQSLKKSAYLAGAALERIHSDPFVCGPSPNELESRRRASA